jgi:hypothetical protein
MTDREILEQLLQQIQVVEQAANAHDSATGYTNKLDAVKVLRREQHKLFQGAAAARKMMQPGVFVAQYDFNDHVTVID